MSFIEKRLLTHMVHHSYWEAESQTLWCDFRKIVPKLGVQSVMSWDEMMVSSMPIPVYHPYLNPLAWPKNQALSDWQKQIPNWVKESCLLFPTHQMQLLHYCGRYPQMLTLLDEAPMLAWQLVKSPLTEPEIVALLAHKRIDQVVQIGWPGKRETLKFIHKLRLRKVTPDLLEQVEVCVLDADRSLALEALPRINSMALSLAAKFPKMIGCQLHQTLAAMPCRPMQCNAMVALLEDAYAMAQYFNLPQKEIDKIGKQRYLVEVEALMANWLQKYAQIPKNIQNLPGLGDFKLGKKPQKIEEQALWWQLSWLQNHLWLIYWSAFEAGEVVLWAYQDKLDEVVTFVEVVQTHELLCVRQGKNQLPTAEQLSYIHLWQAT